MRNDYANYHGRFVRRVNKAVARRAYNNGVDVVLSPVNCSLDSPFYNLAMEVNKDDWGLNRDFDFTVDRFELYNCVHELGKYAAYYI